MDMYFEQENPMNKIKSAILGAAAFVSVATQKGNATTPLTPSTLKIEQTKNDFHQDTTITPIDTVQKSRQGRVYENIKQLHLSLKEKITKGDSISVTDCQSLISEVIKTFSSPDSQKSTLTGLFAKLIPSMESKAFHEIQSYLTLVPLNETERNLLSTALFGAHGILDSDRSGSITPGDVAFTKFGRTSHLVLSDSIATAVALRTAIVKSCQEIAKVKNPFGDNKFTSSLWEKKSGYDIRDHLSQSGWMIPYVLKSGVKPSAALDDMVKNPNNYKFECATAIVIVHYRAMQKLLGNEKFDSVFQNMIIGPWESDEKFNAIFTSQEMDHTIQETGIYGYYQNHDVSQEGLKAGWQGENVIFINYDEYKKDWLCYGHPFGIEYASKIKEKLDSHRNIGSEVKSDQVPVTIEHQWRDIAKIRK